MFDPCPPKPDWESRLDYDALTECWPATISFVNPPYSAGALFVTKAAIELLDGRSSVLFLPTNTLNSKFNQAVKRCLGQELVIGPVKFIGGHNATPLSLSLLFLLSPEVLSFIERSRLNFPALEGSIPNVRDPSMLANAGFKSEKFETLALIYEFGATVKEASILSKLKTQEANLRRPGFKPRGKKH